MYWWRLNSNELSNRFTQHYYRTAWKTSVLCCQGWWPVVALAYNPGALQVCTSSFRGLACSKPRSTRFHTLRHGSWCILVTRVFLTATFVIGGEAEAAAAGPPPVHNCFSNHDQKSFSQYIHVHVLFKDTQDSSHHAFQSMRTRRPSLWTGLSIRYPMEFECVFSPFLLH